MNAKAAWPFLVRSCPDDLLNEAAATPEELAAVPQPDGPNVGPSAGEKEAAEGKAEQPSEGGSVQ